MALSKKRVSKDLHLWVFLVVALVSFGSLVWLSVENGGGKESNGFSDYYINYDPQYGILGPYVFVEISERFSGMPSSFFIACLYPSQALTFTCSYSYPDSVSKISSPEMYYPYTPILTDSDSFYLNGAYYLSASIVHLDIGWSVKSIRLINKKNGIIAESVSCGDNERKYCSRNIDTYNSAKIYPEKYTIEADFIKFPSPTPTPTPTPTPPPFNMPECIKTCTTPKIDECSSLCGEGMTKKVLKCNSNCLKLGTKTCKGECKQKSIA